MDAIDHFKTSKNVRLTTVSAYWIWQRCSRLKLTNTIIRVPYAPRSQFSEQVRQARSVLTSKEEYDTEAVPEPNVWEEVAESSDFTFDNLTRSLPPRDRQIVRGRFVDGLTLAQLGEMHGVTRERIRQVLVRSMKLLKERLAG
jgi:RNA polymerase sigma factor (sigma-70 family)